MGAIDEDRASRAEEFRVDIENGGRHVVAVLAIEDEREVHLVADSQDGEGRQALRIRFDAADVDALSLELFADEATKMVVTNTGQHTRAQAETGQADGRIGRAASDVFRE